MKPELQEFASSNAWYAKTGTIDVDASPDLATRFNVNALPTLLVFRDGTLANESLGYKKKSELNDLVFDR